MKPIKKTIFVLLGYISIFAGGHIHAESGLKNTTLDVKVLSELGSLEGEDLQMQIGKLSKIIPVNDEVFAAFFKRSRASSDEERRAVLTAIGAAVPDIEGKFATPGRQTAADVKKADAFDWLEALAGLDKSSPGYQDVLSDVATIRILGTSSDWNAAHLILDFVFSEEGLIYRDEGGRRLRNMSPLSLPALIHGSQDRKDASRSRYSTYQLERLDRQNTNKAFADTPTEGLKIAVLKAFSQSGYREAVYTVLDQVNHINPRVRKAARESWMEYIDGKPPKAAPRRKLELPGGKRGDKKEPLWLNHRELAAVALRKKLKSLTNKTQSKRNDLVASSKELFDFYDNERKEDLNRLFTDGKRRLKKGEFKEAAALFDKVLVRDPKFDRREQMARAYFESGKIYEKEELFQEASTNFAKSNAVSPDGGLANDALAKHHLMRAKISEENGDDATAEFAQAKVVEKRQTSNDSPTNNRMIWLSSIFLGLALVVFLFAIRKHRQSS